MKRMTVAFLALVSASATMAQEPVVPEYAANGDLKVPVGYKRWIFVGSNLGLGYTPSLPAMTAREAVREEKGAFHNIYITPEAYESFIANGTFPDPTILVMEHFEAQDREPRGLLSEGVYNGKRSGFEVAVKNSSRPDGSATPWAYFVFTDRGDPSAVMPTAPAFPDVACYDCHLEHASTDNVWVQFYPVLRDKN